MKSPIPAHRDLANCKKRSAKQRRWPIAGKQPGDLAYDLNEKESYQPNGRRDAPFFMPGNKHRALHTSSSDATPIYQGVLAI